MYLKHLKMLKACWGCIAGNTKEQSNNELVYGTQLNGDSQRTPPWPVPREQNEIMFVLPRILNYEDRVTILGALKSDWKYMSVNLITGTHISPDYQNIALQFEAHNHGNDTGQIIIKVIQNGEEIVQYEVNTSMAQYFSDGNFTFDIKVRSIDSNYIPKIDISIYSAHFETVQLKHSVESIRFLTLNGDIKHVRSLNFKFPTDKKKIEMPLR